MSNASQDKCPDCTGGLIDTSGHGHYETCEECGGSGRAALASTPSPLQAPAVVAEAAQLLGVPVSRDATMDEWAQYKARAYLQGIANDLRNGDRERHAAARLIDRLAGRQVAQPAVRVPLTEAERTELIEDHGLHEGPASWRDVEVFLEATEQACAKKWGVPLSSEKGDGQ